MRAVKNLSVGLLLVLFLLISSSAANEKVINRMEFSDANLLDVLKAVAAKSGFNLVVSSDSVGVSSKKISVTLKNISPEDAIDLILRANGYSFDREGDTILVSSLPKDLSSSAFKGRLEVMELKHISADRILSILDKAAPHVSCVAGPASNTIILNGKTSDTARARDLVLSLDKKRPLVLIESKVVEISESGMNELGIRWGREEGKFKFSIDKNTGDARLSENILSAVEALVGEGKAKVVASPSIATIDDHEAAINIGSRIPYAVPAAVSSSGTEWSVHYLEAGVSLKIVPRVGSDGSITAKIKPEVSSISEWRATAAGEFPVITTRNAEATVRVQDGETIAVGGLINEAERQNTSRLPLLGDIPLLGMFFGRNVTERSKTEIVFFITPKIIK